MTKIKRSEEKTEAKEIVEIMEKFKKELEEKLQTTKSPLNRLVIRGLLSTIRTSMGAFPDFED